MMAMQRLTPSTLSVDDAAADIFVAGCAIFSAREYKA